MRDTNQKLIAKHELTLGAYYFYNNYFIAEIKEGETISLDKLDELTKLVLKYYSKGQPFSYISNRIHSHSIQPHQYAECPLFFLENFIGYAVVTYNPYSTKFIEVEKHFAKRPFYNFSNLKDAIAWTNLELHKISKQSATY